MDIVTDDLAFLVEIFSFQEITFFILLLMNSYELIFIVLFLGESKTKCFAKNKNMLTVTLYKIFDESD